MNIQKLYNSYGIKYAAESDRHYREGWVNIPCPFCTGNAGNHLGYDLQNNYFKCWRCGYHSTYKVLMKLLDAPYHEIKKIFYQYKGKGGDYQKQIKIKTDFRTPSNLKCILDNIYCFNYLHKRGFDPIDLQTKYDIKCTGPTSSLDNINFKFRIFIPIFYDNKMVSWQTRDCTDKSSLKYISCPSKREYIQHKTILYQTPLSDLIVLCEGVFDVWKVENAGYPSTCTFGIGYKTEQLLELIKHYEKIIIFFDYERQAQQQANEIKNRLMFTGKKVINICPPLKKAPSITMH